MARVIKEYAVRRGEILDATQRLIYTKGFEQMTIQDILDDLQISKGAFYHYFDSKQALLEALIDRIIEEAEQLLQPIVDDPNIKALEKFQVFFDSGVRWKTAKKDFLIAILHIWYKDENAIVRYKINTAGLKRITPLLTKIIRQGNQEGILKTPFPDQSAEIVTNIILGLSESIARFILVPRQGDNFESISQTVGAYTDTIERAIGAPKGSLTLFDPELLKEWVPSATN